MDKLEFNKLDTLDQLKFVNKELAEGGSLRNISSNLGMSKTTIRDRLKKIGYSFNGEARQYLKDTSSNTNVLHTSKAIKNKPIITSEYKENINILHDNIKENKPKDITEYKGNTNIFNDKDINKKVINIVSKYDDLFKMIEVSNDIQEMLAWYNKQKNIVEPVELKIDSNKLTGEVKTTTVRLYNDVWDQFKEFMESFKEYKSMDLISMALIEYMDKYKK